MARLIFREGAVKPVDREDNLERFRLHSLFSKAVENPLVVVSAGAGYGKTQAVYTFLQKYDAVTIWVQLSKRDNLGDRFWENFASTILPYNKKFAARLNALGFPNTESKFEKYLEIVEEELLVDGRYVVVIDDFHLLTNKPALKGIERAIQRAFRNLTIIIISRTEPEINVVGMMSKGLAENISEAELRFTEQEIAAYLKQSRLAVSTESLQNIYADTEGWAFAVNLIVRSLKKDPEHPGYAHSAAKLNIYKLLETEVLANISDKLTRFLIRLSLIDHLSADLIGVLAGGEPFLKELSQLNAYVRYDAYTNAYHIHHLFLELLAKRQHTLTEEERRETYTKAAKWCAENDYKIDAIAYYGKAGDYENVLGMLYHLPQQIPPEPARFILSVLDEAPPEELGRLVVFPALHLRLRLSLGQYEETLALAAGYIKRYEAEPESAFTNRVLSGVYVHCGVARLLMATETDVYDMDVYMEKGDMYYSRKPYAIMSMVANQTLGPWVSMVGTDRIGAMEEYIDSLVRAVPHAVHAMGGCMAGMDALARGELLFFQNKIKQAESFLEQALAAATERKQYDVRNRALFYLMRIGFVQGDYARVRHVLDELEKQLDEPNYYGRYMTYDICRSWYYLKLGQPHAVVDWLRNEPRSQSMTMFSDEFYEQIHGRYLFCANRLRESLACILTALNREGAKVLIGQIEKRALESVCRYRMKDKDGALNALVEAYRIAQSNNLTMPFIELGKDMRTLTRVALDARAQGGALVNDIPKPWLEDIHHKAASYAKRQSALTGAYRNEYGLCDTISLTAREKEFLTDLYNGLTRAEIAAQRELSINTVKSMLNLLYLKLGAENNASAIRIALEKKLI